MILRTTVKCVVYPEELVKDCTRAEHAVAVQAERDSRRYVPSKKLMNSGTVTNNIITWSGPNARLFYFGNIYENPKTHVAGFQIRNGAWISHPGRKVRRTQATETKALKFKFKTGTDQWFTKAKKDNLEKWVRLAAREIAHG